MRTLRKQEKQAIAATQVDASQNNRQLKLMGFKSKATLHNIPCKKPFLEERIFRVTSPILALVSKLSYIVRIQAGHYPNQWHLITCLLDTGTSLGIITSKLIQGN